MKLVLNKKYIVSILIIIFLIILGLIIKNRYFMINEEILNEEQLLYSYYLDGEKVDSISYNAYFTKADCINANAYWDYSQNVLRIENIQTNASCDLYYQTIESQSLSAIILNSVGQETGDGTVSAANGYRYQGKNPDNFIVFNDELWRIIGIVSDQNYFEYVKIVKYESLLINSFDAEEDEKYYVSNEYNNSMIKTLLNSYYYENSPYYAYISGNVCLKGNYNYYTCDFTSTGLDDYQYMIEKINWFIGGTTSYKTTSSSWVSNEKKTTSSELAVGLPSASDYIYSFVDSSCEYSKSNCKGESWLFTGKDMWLINENSNTTNQAYYVNSAGYINSGLVNNPKNIYPVVHLSYYVNINAGSGTKDDPYRF